MATDDIGYNNLSDDDNYTEIMLYNYNGNFLFSTYIDNENRARIKDLLLIFHLPETNKEKQDQLQRVNC